MIQRLTGSSAAGAAMLCARADAVHLQEARGVPQLGGEVAVALDALLIELDVAALAFHRRQREAQRVGAIFVDQAERVDRVALRLGHLLALGVADQAVEVERLPRPLAHELEALHRHAGIPEEDDVEAGDQDVVGVVALEVVRSRSGQPSVANGHSAELEPGVEHILVLAQRRLPPACALRLFLGLGDENIAVVVVPGRNAVAPP